MSWNCNGFRNKFNELIDFVNENDNIDVIFIQESKMNNNSHPPKLTSYNSINKPNNAHSGGLITYVRNHLEFSEYTTPTSDNETQAILIDNILLVNYYCSPQFTNDIALIETLFDVRNKAAIIGDYNAKNVAWNCNSNNRNGNLLYNYALNSPITINYPTNNHTHFPYVNGHAHSTIDLCLSKNLNIEAITSTNALNSDHNPIIIKFSKQIVPLPKTFGTTKTDWTKYGKFLQDNVKLNNNINDTAAIENEIEDLNSKIKSAFNLATKNIKKDFKIEFPQNIKDIIKLKNRTRAQWQRNRSRILADELRYLNKLVNSLIKSYKTEKWNETIRTITKSNKTKLYSIAKALKRKTDKKSFSPLEL